MGIGSLTHIAAHSNRWPAPMIMRAIIIFVLGLLSIGCSEDRVLNVGLQPYDHFDKRMIDTISIAIKRTYGFNVVILTAKGIPPEAFVNTKSPRYRADKLIRILKREKPDTLDYIIGLTDKDISFTKKDQYGNIKKPESKYSDWGIFGLGYRPGPSCVISTFRLSDNNESKFIDRIKKVSLHELGHNLGLDHCTSQHCLMRDAAETIKTIDLVKIRLCDKCKEKL